MQLACLSVGTCTDYLSHQHVSLPEFNNLSSNATKTFAWTREFGDYERTIPGCFCLFCSCCPRMLNSLGVSALRTQFLPHAAGTRLFGSFAAVGTRLGNASAEKKNKPHVHSARTCVVSLGTVALRSSKDGQEECPDPIYIANLAIQGLFRN